MGHTIPDASDRLASDDALNFTDKPMCAIGMVNAICDI